MAPDRPPRECHLPGLRSLTAAVLENQRQRRLEIDCFQNARLRHNEKRLKNDPFEDTLMTALHKNSGFEIDFFRVPANLREFTLISFVLFA